ncbi:MAG TPA: hypothetical protein VK168_18200 [Saprospiraceae bacterium]|nr:hypothetical protein [Saprospiraceae bacterium]
MRCKTLHEALVKFVCVLVLGALPMSAPAQELSFPRIKTSSSIRAGFNGSLIYPGFRGGLEFPFKRIAFTRFRGIKAPRTSVKDRFLSAELAFYHHPDYHDNLYVVFGCGFRRVKTNGFFWEFTPALGYSRTLLGGETYRVNHQTRVVTRVRYPGYHYAILSLGSGMGKALTPRLSVFSRISALIMAPSNNIVYLRPSLELGLIFTPEHFLITEPKVVSRSKGKLK